MRGRDWGTLAFAAVLALSAAAQVAGSRSKPVTIGSKARARRQPYTAEYRVTRMKTLAGGTTITHESTEVRASDSEGRVMTSRTDIPESGGQTVRTHFQVVDPVARTTSTWDSPGQKATVTAMPAPGAQGSCTATAAPPGTVEPPKPVIEDLGTETIEGVEARGRRTTWQIAAGTIGNGAPLNRTNEVWFAVATVLRGLTVREIMDDPQSGKTDRELVILNQSDPDASVFQPPAGYEFVNKKAPLVQCATAQAAPAAAQPPQ